MPSSPLPSRRIHLVKDPAVGEVKLLRLRPAPEDFVDLGDVVGAAGERAPEGTDEYA
jgi:hypothetical protein